VTDPTAEDARRMVATTLGADAVAVRRFTTGLQHFVYEVTLADGQAVVARMTRPSERALMRSAVALSTQLRPLGIPLPELLASDIDAPFPWMLLERLPGTDLGDLVGSLDAASLRAIADRVAAAQAIAARTPSAGRYGFAPTPQSARFATWSDVIAADIERSRTRIAAAGLFNLAAAEGVERESLGLRDELDAVPATPFLHDTTTKNVIVTTGGEFSGIVDVDDLCFGDPRFVPALTEVALRAHDLPADYAGYLMDAAGWPDDRLYRLYVAVIFLGFMSEHGQRFNDNQPTSTAEDRSKLLALYEDALGAL
jgi:aminoglycoside phosphotransferase (APT) family kinase protein